MSFRHIPLLTERNELFLYVLYTFSGISCYNLKIYINVLSALRRRLM